MFEIDKKKLHPNGVVEKQYSQMAHDLMEFWDDSNSDGLSPEKVEDVSCSLCNASPPPIEKAIFKKFRFPYFCCPECSLVYPSPRPNLIEIENQYESGRFASSFHDLYLPSAEYRMSTIFRERVEDIIIPRVSSGRILDVGCSSGHFLKVAHNRGFEVFGIEPNPEMVNFATEELRLPNVQAGYLGSDSIIFLDEFFDAVTLWDVLEHVPQPQTLLSEIKRILKPNGWLFGYTENFESFNVFITGSDSEMICPDVHLRHYTPNTFKREFEQAGFQVREVLTKGLDIQHIETTVKLNPQKYTLEVLYPMFENSEKWQNIINSCGKGDNLRIYCQKRM